MTDLLEKISDSIDRWDIVSLNSEIKKKEHEEWIRNNAWDLIPLLVEPAHKENLQKCPQVVHACSQILADHVAKLGNPKEIIISLLEHCEHSGSSIKFRHCLPALEIALLKLELRASSLTWDWVLRTIVEHLISLELPELAELEGEERLLFEHDQEYCDRLSNCQEVTSLLTALSYKLHDFEEGPAKVKLKGYIIWSCVNILGYPLSYFNVCKTQRGNSSTAKVVCDQLALVVSQLCPDQIRLIDFEDFCSFYDTIKMRDSDRDIWQIGIGTLFYCQFFNDDPGIPLCYSPFHVYIKLLKSMIAMLAFVPGQTAPYFRQEKSLLLCNALISRVPLAQIPSNNFELDDQVSVVESLYTVIIYHGLESVRKAAYQTYNRFCDVFGSSPKSLSLIVKHAFEKANHSGLMGHAIGKLKNGVLAYMNRPCPELSGSSLKSLVLRFCQLKNGVETDLLEVSDELMSGLNFLVCVYLRDKNNRLELWNVVPELEETFLRPLQTGLSMSRAHYQLKLNEPMDTDGGAEVNMMVGGQALPEMSREQMKEVIRSALNTFDMMECVLCQLNDVILARKARAQ